MQGGPQLEAQPAAGSWLYLPERFDIGLVHLKHCNVGTRREFQGAPASLRAS
jgi:hypothetical protein